MKKKCKIPLLFWHFNRSGSLKTRHQKSTGFFFLLSIVTVYWFPKNVNVMKLFSFVTNLPKVFPYLELWSVYSSFPAYIFSCFVVQGYHCLISVIINQFRLVNFASNIYSMVSELTSHKITIFSHIPMASLKDF